MPLGYAIVAVLAAAMGVFAIQNSEPTSVRFLFWGADGVPMSAVILLALAAGIVAVGLPLGVQNWRLRARTRLLEERIADLETQLSKRGDPPRTSAYGS